MTSKGVYRINSNQIRRIGSGAKLVATVPWYLAGGISPANCIAAYQPKGAASYAASKVNLANPGTYDATEGVTPIWNATDGWVGTGSQYLYSPVILSNNHTIVVRGKPKSSTVRLVGATNITNWFVVYSNYANNSFRYYMGNTYKSISQSAPNGREYIWAVTKDKGYSYYFAEGSSNSVAINYTNSFTLTGLPCIMLGYNYNGSPIPQANEISAISFYDTTLSDGQISELITAMAAL